MTAFAILLVAAALAFGLSKALHLPAIPLLMLSGVGLRFLANRSEFDIPDELLSEVIEIGLAMLVFTAGTELSPRRMRGRFRPVTIVAVTQFFMLGFVGVCTALLLGYELTTALYVGCALSASSTLVAVRHLQTRRQMFEPFGRLVLGVLLLQDIFIVLIMVALLKAPLGWLESIHSVANAIALGIFSLGVHKWFVPWVTRRHKLDDEELMLGALSMLFAFSGMAHLLELPFLVGAFFAGFALSAFPMNGLVRGMLGSLSGFFLALFFICIGAFLTLPSPQMLGHSLIFIAMLVLVTVTIVAIVAEAVGYTTRASIETGILLSQTSEFSLLLALTGLASGQISPELFSMIAFITVTTMTLTPFFSREKIAWSLMHWHPRYRKGEARCGEMSGHAVLLGYGRAGPSTVHTLKQHGLEVVVLDDDAGVIRKLIAQKIPCIQGDGSDEHMLRLAHAREAKVVLCSMRRRQDAQLTLDYLKNSEVKVLVRTFEHEESAMVRAAGGYPIEASMASARTFFDWLSANLPDEKHKAPEVAATPAGQ
ncbi:cation:proton antiporter [Coraliomargarita parva]|uniref:cation:proton antiporter n=1 Tax=Coraliomargarita parva TaxID=3014050 RepID=UPI0022B2BE5F|nr:cation:proton antiporter [Coraliomargarita parva]